MVGIPQPVSKGCDYWECGTCGSDLTFKLRPLFEKTPRAFNCLFNEA